MVDSDDSSLTSTKSGHECHASAPAAVHKNVYKKRSTERPSPVGVLVQVAIALGAAGQAHQELAHLCPGQKPPFLSLSSALRAHTNAPYKIDLLEETLKAA
jgi:hypothetical protein